MPPALLPCRLADEIPVKDLEMTEVENYPVALENRSFAEYVLIGTLLSACLALATGGLLRVLLP